MGWSFRIARIAGIEVRIHVTFLLLLAYFGYRGYSLNHSMAGAVNSLVQVLSLFLCVLLHEFGHALAAARYGIKTPDITLLPIGGVARLQRMPDKPLQELVVAIAGPLVNVVIAAAIFIGFSIRSGFGAWDIDNPRMGILPWLLGVNIVLVLFNLIPAFPMDGGRVLRALLATHYNYAKATRIAARVGQVLAFGFGILGLMGNPLLILIAIFVYFGAGQEAAAAQMRDLARAMAVNEAMVTDFRALGVRDTLENAVEALLRTSQHEFPVIDDAGNVVGLLTRNDMIHALRLHGPQVPVTAIMRRDVPSVALGSSFEQAFRTMNETQTPAVLVRDWNGRLVGVVTPENVGEMMMVHEAMDQQNGRRPGAWGAPVASTEPGGLAPPPVPLPNDGELK
jgi:Zn-dependent protease/CBS domain-containing protein